MVHHLSVSLFLSVMLTAGVRMTGGMGLGGFFGGDDDFTPLCSQVISSFASRSSCARQNSTVLSLKHRTLSFFLSYCAHDDDD